MLTLVVPASLLTNVTTNIAKRVYFEIGGDRGIKNWHVGNYVDINSIQLTFVVFLFPKIKLGRAVIIHEAEPH